MTSPASVRATTATVSGFWTTSKSASRPSGSRKRRVTTVRNPPYEIPSLSFSHGRTVCEGIAMRVGDTARRSREVRERDIELFTELTGDRNPLHSRP